jgi:hypothetical protein
VSSAIAGLIGAAIGAIAGIAGAIVTQYLQIRAERTQALRSKRVETYTNTLQCLLKVRGRRATALTLVDLRALENTAYARTEDQVRWAHDTWLPQKTFAQFEGDREHFRYMLFGDITAFREETFDDIVGARLWLTSAIAYCSPRTSSPLVEAMARLEAFATNILEGDVVEGGRNKEAMFWSEEYDDALQNSYQTVLACAQNDLRDVYA